MNPVRRSIVIILPLVGFLAGWVSSDLFPLGSAKVQATVMARNLYFALKTGKVELNAFPDLESLLIYLEETKLVDAGFRQRLSEQGWTADFSGSGSISTKGDWFTLKRRSGAAFEEIVGVGIDGSMHHCVIIK